MQNHSGVILKFSVSCSKNNEESSLAIFRFACSITDEDTNTIIITGGQYTMAIVSRYNSEGFVEDLPSLSTGRYLHGCEQFVDSSNEKEICIKIDF